MTRDRRAGQRAAQPRTAWLAQRQRSRATSVRWCVKAKTSARRETKPCIEFKISDEKNRSNRLAYRRGTFPRSVMTKQEQKPFKQPTATSEKQYCAYTRELYHFAQTGENTSVDLLARGRYRMQQRLVRNTVVLEERRIHSWMKGNALPIDNQTFGRRRCCSS